MAAAAFVARRLVGEAPPAHSRGGPPACRQQASEGEWAQRGAASVLSGG